MNRSYAVFSCRARRTGETCHNFLYSCIYSRLKRFAAVSHPPRHHSGGAGTAWQQRWTHLSPPAGGKGIPKGRVPLALPRAGAARRVGEKRKTFSLASICFHRRYWGKVSKGASERIIEKARGICVEYGCGCSIAAGFVYTDWCRYAPGIPQHLGLSACSWTSVP